MRDSFIFYRSFYEAIETLPEKEQLDIYRAIAHFSLDCEEIELSGISKTVFLLIKPQLEANIKRYQSGIKAKQIRNKTEANDKQTISKTEANDKQTISKTEANDKQTISKTEANVNVNVNVNENVNENENLNENENGNVVADDSSEQQPPHLQFIKFGEYKHIKLTQEQYNKLSEDYSYATIDDYIRKMDEWIQLNGKKKYKDYNLAIRNWITRDGIKKGQYYGKDSIIYDGLI